MTASIGRPISPTMTGTHDGRMTMWVPVVPGTLWMRVSYRRVSE